MIEQAVTDLYDEAAAFFAERRQAFGDQYLAYRLLYGPPLEQAPVMFVGFQPGGGGEAKDYDEPTTWPAVCDYAVADWRLARELQAIFGRLQLERSTGVNLVFARAPSKRAYFNLDRELIDAVERFSRPRVTRLIELIRPQRLVFIGLQTAESFGDFAPVEVSARGRTLLTGGSVGGIPARAVLHLSGCRISADDRVTITQHLRGFADLPALA